MNINAHTTTLRNRTRLTASYPAGDVVTVTRARVPSEVSPGETFVIELDVATSHESLPFVDADNCTTSQLDVGGIRVAYELEIGGDSIENGNVCIAQGLGGGLGNAKTIRATVTAPNATGTATVRAFFRGAGTGNPLGDWFKTITVTSSTTGGDWTPDDDNNNGGDGDGGGDPDKPCGGFVDALTRPDCSLDDYFQQAGEGAMLMLVGFAALFVLAAAR